MELVHVVFPATLAVLGILSSCPRVMTMQCWKSPIPPPLSTRLFVVVVFFGVVRAERKETRLSEIPQRNENSKTNEKRTLHIFSKIPKIPKFPEYRNDYPKFQNHSKVVNISEKHKKINENTKSKGKRPNANVSSHNACRFGYPFFLSPSDDDAMLEIPNPTSYI